MKCCRKEDGTKQLRGNKAEIKGQRGRGREHRNERKIRKINRIK
jgi:hypothetical protein